MNQNHRYASSRRQWMASVAGAAAVGGAAVWPAAAATPAAPASAPASAPATTPARRLISVGGAITEVVYALGAEALLVASDTTSTYPEAASRMPKVGYLRQLSAEGLLSLRPDVVVGSGEMGPPVVLEQMQAAGVRVVQLPTAYTLESVLHKVQVVGDVTGHPAQAQALVQQLQTQWQAVRAQLAHTTRQPRALFVLSHNGSPMVSGRGTAAHALMELAGAHNVVQQFEGYRPLTAEAMASVAPDVIINTTQGIEALGGADAFWQRPELALTPAFARRALVTMEASHLLGFGPRLPSAVHMLHEQLQKAVA